VLETSWHRENQPAQFHPASTHAANRKPSSFQTDGANSTGCVQPRKKMEPTDLPFSGAKPIIHSNKNTTSQITINLGATNSPLEANPLQVHYT